MRNISSWAIKNPIPPIVFFLVLTFLGLVSFNRMAITQNPDITFPLVSVTVSQPGAAPSEMEKQITQIIEGSVAGVNGVDHIISYSTEGLTTTNIEFKIGVPVDRAVNDTRDAVTKVRSQLPEGIQEPIVQRQDFDGGPLAYYSVSTTDMTLEQLSWFIDNDIAKRLRGVEGVASIGRSGGVTREIRVNLDPARLQSFGVTAVQINGALRLLNLDAAGGRAEVAGAEQSLRVLGGAKTAETLAQTQISLPGGRMIRLADVATVKDAFAEQRALGRLNGRQVTSFSISKSKGASEVTAMNGIEKQIVQIEKDNPKVKFTLLYDGVQYVRDQYRESIRAMIEGAVLAVIVVFIFLRDWRATLISALAIPLSCIPAFFFMDAMGFTLNGLSLLALSLVAGILVDDAIVEIENIVRHMRMGKTPYQASMEAADEIGLAVVATTFAIVAVFLPVALMPGISGQFFKSFGLTVVISVLMSLLVARLITPMVAAYFLKAHGHREHASGAWMHRYLGLLRWTIRNRWKTVGLGVLAFVATLGIFMTLPSAFQPPVDAGTSQVSIELPPGARLEDTARISAQASAILRKRPEVKEVYEAIGDNDETRFATLYINLVDRSQRKLSTVEFQRDEAPELKKIADARVFFQSQDGGVGGHDITVMLVGDDPVSLVAGANKVIAGMKKLPSLRDARIDGDLKRPEIVIKPRFDLAANLGVSVASLSQTIRIATIGDIPQNLAKFSLSDRQVPIRVQLPEETRSDLTTIQNLPVPTASGGSVPLKVVADIAFGEGPTKIRRYDQSRRLAIVADLTQGAQSGDALNAIHALPAFKALPSGVREIKFGQAQWMGELLLNFLFAVIAGVLLVFAVLVLLYRRVLPPFVNMLSLLLAPLGGVIALKLTGFAVSMPVFIGLLMLFGIVAKNSILLVDFAIEEMRVGVDRVTAIMNAGHKRAQPIVMTTVAMVAGMMPVALSLGSDGSWNQPMAITVIGGLIVSTLLTLCIVPAGFTLADDLEKWLGPKFSRYITSSPTPPAPNPHPAE